MCMCVCVCECVCVCVCVCVSRSPPVSSLLLLNKVFALRGIWVCFICIYLFISVICDQISMVLFKKNGCWPENDVKLDIYNLVHTSGNGKKSQHFSECVWLCLCVCVCVCVCM